MLESLKKWWRLSQYPSLRRWVRQTHTDDELSELSWERTIAARLDPPSAFGSYEIANQIARRRKTVRSLMNYYGDDIWKTCIVAAMGGTEDIQPFRTLARLPGSGMVVNQESFEEFMISNALRSIAIEILEEKSSAATKHT
jgi:hypothetical protein